ncbi:hypothetical protein KL942_001396 [Ogataea angusta]|nr:hypothetical protein KL942_001396 [Ogataea angusta]
MRKEFVARLGSYPRWKDGHIRERHCKDELGSPGGAGRLRVPDPLAHVLRVRGRLVQAPGPQNGATLRHSDLRAGARHGGGKRPAVLVDHRRDPYAAHARDQLAGPARRADAQGARGVARQPYGAQRLCAQFPRCAVFLQHSQAALAVRVLPTQLQLHRARRCAVRVRLARRATARASAGVVRDAREARRRENHKTARPGETQNDAHVDGDPDARDPDPAPGPHAGPAPDAAEPRSVQGALLRAGDLVSEARGHRHRGGQPGGAVLPRAARGGARRAGGQLAHAAAVPATDRGLCGPENGAP